MSTNQREVTTRRRSSLFVGRTISLLAARTDKSERCTESRRHEPAVAPCTTTVAFKGYSEPRRVLLSSFSDSTHFRFAGSK
ncbi:hypothetical protein MPTK1_7g17930 [Marchantia polymorpha subsp. ruderalis]|uniref:Uncharacterized protein n=2 Tax=Marchantia polymorpha TaxID=3197 RepID=A0AAF6C0X3_MARPO|nr:hypothetical protein MARPO_0102s0047 [Marchantia polymorpha]BBN17907.1 hypothetical protein Mp_7g17930 [Marchantia polymorpha subsp. ruderalis]|eukprot:PTQ32183.1 hypothetical protein MARPO_0102s0047 [Marchantia polymorpha]